MSNIIPAVSGIAENTAAVVAWSGMIAWDILQTPVDSSVTLSTMQWKSYGPIEVDSVAAGAGIVTVTGKWTLN